MSLTMQYKQDNIQCKIKINDDATLSELVCNFIELTRIMGYYPQSWEHIIDEIYGYCVLHVDASEDYDIFVYAADNLSFFKK